MVLEDNVFFFDDVVVFICEKMVCWYLYVFGDEDVYWFVDVIEIWECEKDKERF